MKIFRSFFQWKNSIMQWTKGTLTNLLWIVQTLKDTKGQLFPFFRDNLIMKIKGENWNWRSCNHQEIQGETSSFSVWVNYVFWLSLVKIKSTLLYFTLLTLNVSIIIFAIYFQNAANQLAFKLRTQSRNKNRDKRSAVMWTQSLILTPPGFSNFFTQNCHSLWLQPGYYLLF